MTIPDRFAAPWHKTSFDRFLSERLPALLAERLPTASCTVETENEHTCRLTIEMNAGVTLTYPNLPQPDAQGLFWLEGKPHVVVPLASHEELDKAEIACAGEQLYNYIAARLGQSAPEIEWDEAAARAFLPLDAWFAAFLRTSAQALDTTNWHSRATHLRRLLIPNRTRVVAPGQIGRVDPFETPEGPYIGRAFTVALGAVIHEGRLVITDDRPEATLGHNAAQAPFLEYDDANRLLMGVNMMRQALTPPEAEPALVQTGLSPANAGPDFWCGRNLLTAFVAWGEASAEDGLVISASCARRLDFPAPAEPGDKLANRHGIKGVIAQVLPDAQMPHLADGTPVEIAYSFARLAGRNVLGLVREAVMGRLARAEGQPAIVPPFHAPTTQEMQARLVKQGLSETGMEHLRAGQDGPQLPYPSSVGWVYWYRLVHLARPKLRAVAGRSEAPALEAEHAPDPLYPTWENGQSLGELELRALRQAAATVIAGEALTTRALRSQGNASPYLQELAARLGAAGILAELEAGRQVAFRFSAPRAVASLKLARPLPHPWLPTESIDMVGRPPEAAGAAASAAFESLAQANERLARWQAAESNPAQEPRQSAYLASLLAQLESRLASYCDALLPASALQCSEPQAFSARAVISPAVGLDLDQVGLPAEIIAALFGEKARRQDAPLEEVARQAWVIVHRAPALSPTSLIAFHPLCVEGPSVRLHPQACALLDADFDGDQVGVFLPVSEAAQREAGQKLSVEGHLRRDPGLLPALLPSHEGLWGLAYLSLSQDGRRAIAAILGVDEKRLPSPLTSSALAGLLGEALSAAGPGEALRLTVALARLGCTACSQSGASLSPFPTPQIPLPPAPSSSAPKAWEIHAELCAETILAARDYHNPNLGPQLLSTVVSAKSRRTLPYLLASIGWLQNAEGQVVIARHSPSEGRPPAELFASVAGARQGLARLAFEGEEILKARPPAEGANTVIARARRARHPGIVFARAAASQEVDTLTDEETRILTGYAKGLS